MLRKYMKDYVFLVVNKFDLLIITIDFINLILWQWQPMPGSNKYIFDYYIAFWAQLYVGLFYALFC